uniref:Uncharacterized protein n=1 Tax=viral metagenome TaxID=1070528 RepID=A0A6C0AQ75_9ZZZZ
MSQPEDYADMPALISVDNAWLPPSAYELLPLLDQPLEIPPFEDLPGQILNLLHDRESLLDEVPPAPEFHFMVTAINMSVRSILEQMVQRLFVGELVDHDTLEGLYADVQEMANAYQAVTMLSKVNILFNSLVMFQDWLSTLTPEELADCQPKLATAFGIALN